MNLHIVKAIGFFKTPSAMARALGVSTQLVLFWRDEKRSLQPIHAADLERLTGGVITRRDFFPETYARIWPDLAEQKAA